MDQRYTATLYANGHIVLNQSMNKTDNLIVFLLNELQDERSGTHGQIFDNYTGEIIHRCRRASIE